MLFNLQQAEIQINYTLIQLLKKNNQRINYVLMLAS